MQEIVHNSYNGSNSLRTSLHLRTASNVDLFNDQSMLTSESDDCNGASEDYQIDFNQTSSQDFGLGYWIKHTNPHVHELQTVHSKSPKNPAFILKTSTYKTTDNTGSRTKSDISCKDKYENIKKPKHNVQIKSQKKVNIKKVKKHVINSNSSKHNSKFNYSIPPLKIPKDVVKKYLKTLSPSSSSSSSSSESESPHHQKIKHNFNSSKHKSKSNHYLSDTPLSNHNDSSCLQKSFLSSYYSKPQSVSFLSAASHDKMLLSMTIDNHLAINMSSLPVIHSSASDSSEITDTLQLESNEKDAIHFSEKQEQSIENNDKVNNSNNKYNIANRILSKENQNENQLSLSTNCDKSDINTDRNSKLHIDFQSVNQLSPMNNRKRVLNQIFESDDEEIEVVAKKQILELPSNSSLNVENPKLPFDDPAVYFVRFLMEKMKNFEEMVHEKYCLSQPNAMKFLAQNHAFQWESNKNDSNQLHLVPYEFIAEIFHRALHCYGLEKRLLKETLNVDSSPFSRSDTAQSTDYKKVRDEYSFSLKRVRYGIGVIDDLFKRKINFQSTQPNNDVIVVRKWKHLIYYLCLQAKAVFMTKEMQYHNYANYVNTSGTYDGDCNLFNTTPTARYSSSSLVVETNNKLQLPKDTSKLFDSKFPKTTPEHLSQFDMDVSPHSYDSGKGSSIRLSSNGNSQVSGCHTTSSLNSTPHSLNEAQLNLPGFHMYRIDEYLKTANEYVQFLPETYQLHSKIISKIGFEPNANCSDNMMRFINYTEVCQQICKQEAMSECLQRLLSQAVRL